MRYRIAALLMGAIIFLLVLGQLIDFSVFTLGSPLELPADTNSAVADWLGSYRAIDLLVQVTLLLAAVMAASAMFRSSNSEVE